MKALVYLKPDYKNAIYNVNTEFSVPMVTPKSAIVKIMSASVHQSEDYIDQNVVELNRVRRILAHEGVGVIDKVGSGVNAFKEGSKILVSCISACGKCAYCRKHMYSHCIRGGWVLDNKINIPQAEFTKDYYTNDKFSLNSEDVVTSSVIAPRNALSTPSVNKLLNTLQPNSTIAIIGAGPVGLAALLGAQSYSPKNIIMIDSDNNRLDIAKRFGVNTIINNRTENVVDIVMNLTGSRGVDAVIDAISVRETDELCKKLIVHNGKVISIGVQSTQVNLHVEHLWDNNITISTSLVDTLNANMLLDILRAKKSDSARFSPSHFNLERILDSYNAFATAINTRAIKVIIED